MSRYRPLGCIRRDAFNVSIFMNVNGEEWTITYTVPDSV